MRIGILSDTHDNLPHIEKAVRLFNRRKVGFVVHAGDFVAPFTVGKLMKLSCEWRGVFGNNDGERKGLSEKSAGRIGILTHDLAAVDRTAARADIIVFGHTHVPEIRRERQALLVNPGECGGWLTGRSTVAVVDLDRLSAQIIAI